MFYIENCGMYLTSTHYGMMFFTHEICKAKGFSTEKDAKKYSVGGEKIFEVQE
jgi:hypothetical protein